MKPVKPSALKKKDLIGIITPASTPSDLTRIDKGLNYLEQLGYNVEVGKNVGKSFGYLAGTDAERLADLHYMFAKKEVKAIICARGGYGTPRLLNKIDFKLIKKNPKIFVGYSDITVLQMAFLKKANLVTFAGPMLAVDFHNDISKFTEEMFWQIVTSTKKFGKVILPSESKINTIHKGKSEGRIIGGNLALLLSVFGSSFLPDFKDKILLIEDVGEAPYRIDRMLNQLRVTNTFNKIAGLIAGQFTECIEKDPETKTLSLDEIFTHYFSEVKVPVIDNFPHGHIKHNVTIPFGIKVKLNASKGYVEYLENAVE